MFEKFDEEARQVVIRAHNMASKSGFKSIRPVHLAIAASEVLDMDLERSQMPFSSASNTCFRNLDNKAGPITAKMIYEECIHR